MSGEKPDSIDVDSYGRYVSKDGVVELSEPSEFDLRDVLRVTQRYNPENDVRDMRRLGKKQELKVRSFHPSLGGQELTYNSADFDSSPSEATSCFLA